MAIRKSTQDTDLDSSSRLDVDKSNLNLDPSLSYGRNFFLTNSGRIGSNSRSSPARNCSQPSQSQQNASD